MGMNLTFSEKKKNPTS